MLDYLHIKNLAVIKETELEFGEGLNVITGETGAGKSMLVNALGLLKGERANTGIIRSDEKNAKIQAVITLEDDSFSKLSQDFFEEAQAELNIERLISTSGKTRIKINDSLVTVKKLAEIMNGIIEISSQHGNQTLLSSSNYLKILDSYAGLTSEVIKLGEKVKQSDKLADKIVDYEAKKNEVTKRIEELDYIEKELNELDVKQGEYDELLKQRTVASSMQSILETAATGEYTLYSADDSAYDQINKILTAAEKISDKVPEFSEISELLRNSIAEIEEAVSILRKFYELNQEFPDIEHIEKRLFKLERVFRKYEVSSDIELIDFLEKIRKEREENLYLDDTILKLKKEADILKSQITSDTSELSKKRQKYADQLSNLITEELRELGFNKAEFKIKITSADVTENTPNHRNIGGKLLSKTGTDTCLFLFNPNPGGKWTSLSQGVSGGELSRIHLALKSVLSRQEGSAVTVYDEIDTGVGGETGFAIGKKLKKLSFDKQIINITHLPQIAAFADHHFVVEKKIVDDKTETYVRQLNQNEHIKEIARMLGGITKESLKHAEAMIEKAAELSSRHHL